MLHRDVGARAAATRKALGSGRATRRATLSAIVAAIAVSVAVQGAAAPAEAARRPYSWITPGQEQPFYASMLQAIGAPATATNLQVMEAWARSEGSRSSYNPWNTTQRAPGATVDSNNCTSFASAESAIAAMKRQFSSLYRPVIAGFVAGSPERTVSAIVASPWAESHYGGAADFRKSLIWQVYVRLPANGWVPMTFKAAPPGPVPVTRARSKRRRVVLRWAATPTNGAGIKRFEVGIRSRNTRSRRWLPWQNRSVHRTARQTSWAGLVPGRRYQVIIRAHNRVGPGSWSRRFNIVV